MELKECLKCKHQWYGPPGAWDKSSEKGCPRCGHLYWHVIVRKYNDKAP